MRHAISRIIAAIAEVELREKAWPSLLPWLNQTTTNPAVTSRETGVYVLYSALETIIDSEPTIISSFLSHFATLLQDPESLEIRSTALRYCLCFRLVSRPVSSPLQMHGCHRAVHRDG